VLYRLVMISLPIMACLMMVGCGGNELGTVGVTGTVTYQDQPVAGANVTFMSEGKPLALGTTDDQGVYTLSTTGSPGAVPGEHKVYITKMEASEDTGPSKPEDMITMGPDAPEAKSLIPKKYNNPATSGLSATVTEDASANVFDFPLKD
jgi:hypothetical protein